MDAIQLLFAALLVLQFLIIISHDWIDLPGWQYGSRVQTIVGRRKLAIATAINAIFPALAAGLAIYYLRARPPANVTDYQIAYCGITVLSAIGMWYVPYLFGTTPKTQKMYQEMYAGTKQVLPPRGDNPRPNVLHLFFHALFLSTLVLALVIRLI